MKKKCSQGALIKCKFHPLFPSSAVALSLFHCSASFSQPQEAAAAGDFAHRYPAVGQHRPTGRPGRGRAQIHRAPDQREQPGVFWSPTQGLLEKNEVKSDRDKTLLHVITL